MALDLAEIIERTRKLKRRLCEQPIGLDTSFVFSAEFLDIEHMAELRQALVIKEVETDVSLYLQELDIIIEALGAGPAKPSDRDLCERYISGNIDARTVTSITGWSQVEL